MGANEVTLVTKDSRQRTEDAITRELQALRELGNRGLLNQKPDRTFGLEGEAWLCDSEGRPWHNQNLKILKRLSGHPIAPELGAQIEINALPLPLTGEPFTAMADQLQAEHEALNRVIEAHDVKLVRIGSLPTLKASDITPNRITKVDRYRDLNTALWKDKDPYPLPSLDKPHTQIMAESVAFESQITSIQPHIKPASLDEFVRMYNRGLIILPLVLALSANAPYLLGEKFWADSRWPIFMAGTRGRADWNPGYIEHWLDPFTHTADTESFPPLLHPDVEADPDPLKAVRSGEIPDLHYLKTQNGTVWPMGLRGVIDTSADDPHVRIEARALPAGPTTIDELANTALLFGGMLSIALDKFRSMPYYYVRYNYLLAARHGLNAKLWWPSPKGIDQTSVCDLVKRLLPAITQGLTNAGIEADEAKRYLDVIKQRIKSRQNGATFQVDRVHQLETAGRLNHADALRAMLDEYIELAADNQPVATWPTCR